MSYGCSKGGTNLTALYAGFCWICLVARILWKHEIEFLAETGRYLQFIRQKLLFVYYMFSFATLLFYTTINWVLNLILFIREEIKKKSVAFKWAFLKGVSFQILSVFALENINSKISCLYKLHNIIIIIPTTLFLRKKKLIKIKFKYLQLLYFKPIRDNKKKGGIKILKQHNNTTTNNKNEEYQSYF